MHRGGSKRGPGLNIEVISEAGGLGGKPPEAMWFFSNITSKLCLIQDLEHNLSKYKEVLSQIWSRRRGGCNPLEDIGCFIS